MAILIAKIAIKTHKKSFSKLLDFSI